MKQKSKKEKKWQILSIFIVAIIIAAVAIVTLSDNPILPPPKTEVLIVEHWANTTVWRGVGALVLRGQGFVIAESTEITKLITPAYKYGSGSLGDVTFSIRERDPSTNQPKSTVLVSSVIPGDSLPTVPSSALDSPTTVTFEPTVLAPGGYCFVWGAPDSAANTYCYLAVTDSSLYSFGDHYRSADGGLTWLPPTWSETTTMDVLFKIYGYK